MLYLSDPSVKVVAAAPVAILTVVAAASAEIFIAPVPEVAVQVPFAEVTNQIH